MVQKCRRCKIKIGHRGSRKGGFWRNPLCEACHREDVVAKREAKAERKASRPDPTAGQPLTPQERRNGGAWGRLTD